MHSSRGPIVVITVALAALAGSASPAGAQPKLRRPRLAVIDRGDQVEVVVSDVKLPTTPLMRVNRERIELPLAGRPVEVNDVFDRGLVMRIDVRGEGAAKTLSVKLRRDHAAVMALAQGAMARQEADGVHLFVPKAAGTAAPVPVPVPEAAGTAAPVPVPVPENPPVAATPTTTAPLTATAGTTVTLAGATLAPVVEPGPDTASATANPNPAATANPKPSPDPTVNANPNPNPNPTTDDRAPIAGLGLTGTSTGSGTGTGLTGGGSGPGFGRAILAVGAIALAGLAVVLIRRRRGAVPAAPGPQLEILATRALGGKNRIVWLGAGERELVIAVGAQRVDLLGAWPRSPEHRDHREHRALPEPGERPTSLRLEAIRDDGEPGFAAGSTAIPRTRTLNTNTSAVSGIMRLRGRLPQLADDVATGDRDADEQWARDILAATGGRR
jgi:flagellar biogenesis protein FliO